MKQYSFNSFTKITIAVVVAIIVGVGGYFVGAKYPPNSLKDNQKVSTTIPTPTEPTVKPEDSTTPTKTDTSLADPTASWKTYANDSYGYSIKYPDNAKVAPGRLLDVEPKQVIDMTTDFSIGEANVLEIVVNYKTKFTNMTLEQYANEFIGHGDGPNTSDIEKVKIGQLDGIEANVKSSKSGNYSVYFAEDSNYFYSFSADNTQSTDFKKMLSSFTLK